MGFMDTAPRENGTIAVSSVGCWEGEASIGLLNVYAIFFAIFLSFFLPAMEGSYHVPSLNDGFSFEHRFGNR